VYGPGQLHALDPVGAENSSGFVETDLSQALLDERSQHLVETVRHLEDTADPLLGDHLWVTS
jgi:hypothetical protein